MFFSSTASLTETQWAMCSVQTQSLFSLDLKITCHPPSLHNSISVSIKVGSESLKTEKGEQLGVYPGSLFIAS